MIGARVRSALVAMVSFGAAVAASGGLRAQAPPAPPVPAARPSVSGPAPARPSAAFSRLFTEYRRGDAGAAILAFARWTPERVSAEALAPSDVDAKDTPTLEALALFHTEAGIASGLFGTFKPDATGELFLGGWGLESVFEVHSYTAYTIVNALVERGSAAHDARVLTFARDWYLVALSACTGVEPPTALDLAFFEQAHPILSLPTADRPATSERERALTSENGKGECADGLADKARHDFGDDAEIKVALGAIREPREMTQAQVAARHQKFDLEYGQSAIYDFDDALRIDPTMTEALIHKGHLLHVQRNEPSAVPLLEQALAGARQSGVAPLRYLAALFLGEVHEDAGDLAGAIPFYQEALTTVPAHTASIALGQALIRSGHVAEGWAVAGRMFGREGQGADPIPDPYVLYPRGEYWELDARLDALREMVRGGWVS